MTFTAQDRAHRRASGSGDATAAQDDVHALLLAYHYLPENNGGVQRAVAMKRYLPEHGVTVTLLTHGAGLAQDPAERANGVVRAFDVTRYGVPFVLFAAFRLLQKVTTLFGASGLRYALWKRNALRQAESVIAARRPDVLIATFPPIETLEIALAVARRHRIPFIADFRDGLTYEPLEPLESHSVRLARYFNQIEQRVVDEAAAIVTVSEPMSAHFRCRGARCVETIPNGFDRAEFDANPLADDAAAQLDPDRINIVYTGRLQRSRVGTRIDALLDAIDAVLSEGKGERLLFHFFGQYTPAELRAFDRFIDRGVVRVGGLLPRAQALAVQRRADILLLVTARGQASIATGKLFEYLGAGRPILALTKGTAAESIVRATGAGWTIAPDDVGAITTLLQRLLADDAALREIRADASRIKSYERAEQMKRYARLLRCVRPAMPPVA